MTINDLKVMSKEQIKGNLGILFIISLIISLLCFVLGFAGEFIPVVGPYLIAIVTPAFALSYAQVYLNITVNVSPSASDALGGFADFWTAFKISFLSGLYIFLWSLLLIIPGIVKAFAYSQAIYVAAENPGISATEAITRSKDMMDGYKNELFHLYLSFIGWHLLAILTFGLLYVWLTPYINTTLVNFYHCVKPKNDPIAYDTPPTLTETE